MRLLGVDQSHGDEAIITGERVASNQTTTVMADRGDALQAQQIHDTAHRADVLADRQRIAGREAARFDHIGRHLLWRIQREVLADPDDGELHTLLEELLRQPTVSPDWREVDLSMASDPALVLHLRRAALELRFLTTITAFQAPQNVAVERLRIEQWFPYDDPTLFLSMEDEQRLQAHPAEIRASYLEEMGRFVEGTKRACAEHATDHELVRSDADLAKLLVNFLARRERAASHTSRGF